MTFNLPVFTLIYPVLTSLKSKVISLESFLLDIGVKVSKQVEEHWPVQNLQESEDFQKFHIPASMGDINSRHSNSYLQRSLSFECKLVSSAKL